MVFRVYILFMIVSFIILFMKCCIVGVVGLVFTTILWPFGQIIHYRNWRKSQIGTEKSLAFGIQSVRLQKQNFKAINVIFARYPMLEKTFKKMSIIFDDMHIEGRNYVWVSNPKHNKKH